MPCWTRIKQRICSASLPYYDVIQSTDLYTEPQQRHIFNTFSSFPLFVPNKSGNSTALLPSLRQRKQSMEFLRMWGISLELRPRKQQEGPFRVGSDGRDATWRGHAWLASPWQLSVFARWSIKGLCSHFCHGLLCYRFPAAGPLLYIATASLLASSTPEQVASGR